MSNLPALETKALSDVARGLYRGERSRLVRLLQTYRPYVCPFDDVIDQVPFGSKVLDVGCGAGLFLMLLAKLERISQAHGFDISEAAVSRARAAAHRCNLEHLVHFETRGTTDGIPSGKWDVVTAIDVLHHVPVRDQRDFFLSLCEVLPPGGRLVVKDMVVTPSWRALANKLHDLVLARQLVHHVDPGQITAWAEGQGLKLIHESRANTLWYGHWLVSLIKPRCD